MIQNHETAPRLSVNQTKFPMVTANTSCGVRPKRRAVWHDISNRFCDPQECLAAYLALEAAEVIAGVKPANLISIPNRTKSCGSNLYQWWHEWGRGVVRSAHLESFQLIDRGTSVLVLIYRPNALSERLALPAVRTILNRAGYSEDLDIPSLFSELSNRIAGPTFPHEIGILLGYPLKDVVGFMGLAKIPYACQGPWKIYGEPSESLHLAECFRWCRQRMSEELSLCTSPFDCLNRYSTNQSFFLTID